MQRGPLGKGVYEAEGKTHRGYRLRIGDWAGGGEIPGEDMATAPLAAIKHR